MHTGRICRGAIETAPEFDIGASADGSSINVDKLDDLRNVLSELSGDGVLASEIDARTAHAIIEASHC